MYSSKTDHQTFVHHMALDPSGVLLASCSSDRRVSIFYRDPLATEPAAWTRCYGFKDHVETATRVAWCLHGEDGRLLATAGADRWLYLYEISLTIQTERPRINAVRRSTTRGHENDVITDVAFVSFQQHRISCLSTASLDGCVRLYDIQQGQFNFLHRITPEMDVDRPLDTRRGGITSIAWFPSLAEEAVTLAVGCMNGDFYLYRFSKESGEFERVCGVLPRNVGASIHCIVWAPPVGRMFQLLVICCRSSVHIVRLNCVLPALEDYECEFFCWPHGAVCAAWSSSASLLYLINDDELTERTILQAADPSNHRSWEKIL